MTPGARVIITAGSCEGARGTVKGPSPHTFDGEPVWYVAVDGLGYTSQIRASFLAPAPAESDEDVCAPLRRAVSG
jgi:hypothetical protein